MSLSTILSNMGYSRRPGRGASHRGASAGDRRKGTGGDRWNKEGLWKSGVGPTGLKSDRAYAAFLHDAADTGYLSGQSTNPFYRDLIEGNRGANENRRRDMGRMLNMQGVNPLYGGNMMSLADQGALSQQNQMAAMFE